LHAEVNVYGNNIKIVIPVQFNKKATSESKEQYIETVQEYWSGRFGKYNVLTVVQEQSTGKRNRVILFKENGRSKVFLSFLVLIYNTGNKYIQKWTNAHESGHLMNLDDHYKDKGDLSYPEKGYENTIMGEAMGKVTETEIDEVIKRNNTKVTKDEIKEVVKKNDTKVTENIIKKVIKKGTK